MTNNIFKVFVIIILVLLFYYNNNYIEQFSSVNIVKNTIQNNKYLSKEIKNKMINIFKKIIKVLNENNIEYFINYGTLLGKCRHDDIIPWDDDIDISINKTEVEKINSINWEKYGLKFIKHGYFYKIFYLKNKKIRQFNHSWPFIDLFVYFVKNNNVYLVEGKKNIEVNYNIIYPLKKTKFLNINTKIPNNSKLLLNELYDSKWETECVMQYYDHINERYITKNKVRTKCDKSLIKMSC